MRYVYPARLERHGDDEIVVSFRDIDWCHTSGANDTEALVEGADALAEAVAYYVKAGEPIPAPSSPLPGEHLVPLPVDMAAKAALATLFRESGLTQAALAERLGVTGRTVRRMLDPRHGTSPSRLNDAIRILGHESVFEVVPSGPQ